MRRIERPTEQSDSSPALRHRVESTAGTTSSPVDRRLSDRFGTPASMGSAAVMSRDQHRGVTHVTALTRNILAIPCAYTLAVLSGDHESRSSGGDDDTGRRAGWR